MQGKETDERGTQRDGEVDWFFSCQVMCSGGAKKEAVALGCVQLLHSDERDCSQSQNCVRTVFV